MRRPESNRTNSSEKLETVELNAARQLVAIIQNGRSPQAQAEAIAKREKWLFEADVDTLQMNTEVREALEGA